MELCFSCAFANERTAATTNYPTATADCFSAIGNRRLAISEVQQRALNLYNLNWPAKRRRIEKLYNSMGKFWKVLQTGKFFGVIDWWA